MQLLDGAYGTLLERHLRGAETVDDLCIRTPSVVVDAHHAYLDAGARSIQTNSFLAFQRDNGRRRRMLIDASVQCAREAIATAGVDAVLVGTLGPASDEPRDYWRDLETMLELEVDELVCETITGAACARAFARAVEEVATGVELGVRIGCSISPSRGIESWAWLHDVAQTIDARFELGLNCCEGPDGLRPALAALADQRGTTWVVPSLGRIDRDVPSRWASTVAELVDDVRVSSVGGCCGTDPACIGELRDRI